MSIRRTVQKQEEGEEKGKDAEEELCSETVFLGTGRTGL